MIKDLVPLIDPSLHIRSGSVFYSGRAAFSRPAPLYIMGINPGGDPVTQISETIAWHTKQVIMNRSENWSAYLDESWAGKKPGTYGMQPRVLHMLRQLRLDPHYVPASNWIFVRTSREAGIGDEKSILADLCWPFHEKVIQTLKPKAIVCFGRTVGADVGRRLGVVKQVGKFTEQNKRRWASYAHTNDKGCVVVTVTHPSIADWTNKATDPTPLIIEAIANTHAVKL